MRRKNHSFIPHVRLLSLFFLFISGCQSSQIRVNDDAMLYDFYGMEDGIRIFGEARMPEGGLNASYEERKERCIEAAKQHANSKWLALTEKTIELQALWHDRLQRGAEGPWQRCFDEATMLRFIPAGATCRVVMLYRCDPRQW